MSDEPVRTQMCVTCNLLHLRYVCVRVCVSTEAFRTTTHINTCSYKCAANFESSCTFGSHVPFDLACMPITYILSSFLIALYNLFPSRDLSLVYFFLMRLTFAVNPKLHLLVTIQIMEISAIKSPPFPR